MIKNHGLSCSVVSHNTVAGGMASQRGGAAVGAPDRSQLVVSTEVRRDGVISCQHS
jgi:hypothetical protein